MPFVDKIGKVVHIEPFNLGRFGVACAKAGHKRLVIHATSAPGRVPPSVFTVVSGVPFEVAEEIANTLPSRRDESHSDKPDPDKDSEGKTPEEGGESKL